MAVCVGVSGALLLAALGCNLEPGYSGSGTKKVAILGDEVTSRSLSELHNSLDPGYLVRIGDVNWSQATQVQPVAQSLADGTPDAVIISLGTFDAFEAAPAATTIAALQTMLSTFPPQVCVVFVDIYTGVGKAGFNPAKAAAINAGVVAFGKPMVEWNAYVSANPGALVGPEKITPSLSGREAFANLLNSRVSNCFVIGEG